MIRHVELSSFIMNNPAGCFIAGNTRDWLSTNLFEGVYWVSPSLFTDADR